MRRGEERREENRTGSREEERGRKKRERVGWEGEDKKRKDYPCVIQVKEVPRNM